MPDPKPHDRVGTAALLRQLAGACERHEITLEDAAAVLIEYAKTLEFIAETEARMANAKRGR